MMPACANDFSCARWKSTRLCVMIARPCEVASRTNVLVRDALIRLAGLEAGDDVMTQTAELVHHRLREVFVRVQPGHARSVLPGLGGDLLLDLGGVVPVVIPDRVQILAGQSRKIVEQI